jgi:hypothetical protein
MNIYPKDSFEIDSSLTGGEIFALLDATVEPPKWFRWKATNNEKYHGEVSLAGFKIWRIIRYRNSFLPIIEGKITPTISGSRIAVTMRLHRFVAVLWHSGSAE